MFRKSPLILMIALIAGGFSLNAQTLKYGHMNLGNLLEQMPDTKKANEELKLFADKLTKEDSIMTQNFEKEYKTLEAEYNEGKLTPVVVQQRQAELQKKQEAIQKFEAEAQQKVGAQRDLLLKPILDRVEAAIKSVAAKNDYKIIFDSSTGAMLFANDTDDVTALVKKELGIN